MADYTENYNLKKPNETDFYNVQDFNDNANIIDSILASKLDANSADNLAKEASVQEVITKVNANAKETSLQNLDNKIGNYSDSEKTSSVFAKLNAIQNNLNKNETLLFPTYQETNLLPQKGTVNVFNIQGSGRLHCFYFNLCPGRYNDTGTSITTKLIIDNEIIFTITATRSDPGTAVGGAYSTVGNFLALDSFYFSYQSSTARYVLKGTTKSYVINPNKLIWNGEINDLVGAHDAAKSYSLISDKSITFKNKVIVSVTANNTISSDASTSSINIGYTLD